MVGLVDPDWTWQAVTAVATASIAFITAAVGIATCYFIRSGIKAMNRSSDERAADRKAAMAQRAADRQADAVQRAAERQADAENVLRN